MQRLEVQTEPPCPAGGVAAPPCLSQRRMLVSLGLQNRAKQGWPSLPMFLHCLPPMVGLTSAFQHCVMLGYPPLGFTHDTANQRGLAAAAALGLRQLEETGRRWRFQGRFKAPQWGQGGFEEWEKGSLGKEYSNGP